MVSPVIRCILLAGLAVLGAALKTPRASDVQPSAGDNCPGALVVAEADLPLGDRSVQIVTSFCPKPDSASELSATNDRLCIFFGLCQASGSKSGGPCDHLRNVSGHTCTNYCNTLAGDLPPIAEDCQAIEDAISIFVNAGVSGFVVKPSHIMTLTFGTCKFFFRNMDCMDLEYTWNDLSAAASGAAAACFPPVMPINSEGLCRPRDGTWWVGAAHS